MSNRYKDHVHTYERSLSNKEVYRCIDADCPHYQKREFLIGKRALCPSCRNPFILEWVQLKYKRPVCLNCSKSKKAVQVRDIKSQIADLFPETPITTANAPVQVEPEIDIDKEMEWR